MVVCWPRVGGGAGDGGGGGLEVPWGGDLGEAVDVDDCADGGDLGVCGEAFVVVHREGPAAAALDHFDHLGGGPVGEATLPEVFELVRPASPPPAGAVAEEQSELRVVADPCHVELIDEAFERVAAHSGLREVDGQIGALVAVVGGLDVGIEVEAPPFVGIGEGDPEGGAHGEQAAEERDFEPLTAATAHVAGVEGGADALDCVVGGVHRAGVVTEPDGWFADRAERCGGFAGELRGELAGRAVGPGAVGSPAGDGAVDELIGAERVPGELGREADFVDQGDIGLLEQPAGRVEIGGLGPVEDDAALVAVECVPGRRVIADGGGPARASGRRRGIRS